METAGDLALQARAVNLVLAARMDLPLLLHPLSQTRLALRLPRRLVTPVAVAAPAQLVVLAQAQRVVPVQVAVPAQLVVVVLWLRRSWWF